MSDLVNPSGDYSSHTSDGFTVSTNQESEQDIAANFQSEEKPKDGPPADPEQEEADRVSEAASELGKKGGKAAAKARAKAEKEAKAGDKGGDVQDLQAERSGDADSDRNAADRGDDTDDNPKPLGKPRDDPRARMLEATRKEAEAKRALAAERAERERLAAELHTLRSQPNRVPAPGGDAATRSHADANDPEPQPAQFNGDEMAYLDARLRWSARDEFRKQQRQHQEAQEKAERQRVEAEEQKRFHESATAFETRWKAAQAEDPDLLSKIDQRILNTPTTHQAMAMGISPGIPNYIASEIFSSEHGVALMLHLTENPDELQRLATLSTPRDVLREIARLEDRLIAATAGTVVKAEPSRARPPVRPVTGSPNAASDDELNDDVSVERHIHLMNARDRKARRA